MAQGTEFFHEEQIVFLGIGLDIFKKIALLNVSVHMNLHLQCNEDNLISSCYTCHLTMWALRCLQTAIKNLEVPVL